MPQRLEIDINENAIENNARIIKSLLKSQTRVMAVVKADGYGHGALAAAEAAARGGAYDFGVATANEGLLLLDGMRGRDPDRPGVNILVLGVVMDADGVRECVSRGIAMTAVSLDSARFISGAARSGNKAKIHIKIDTGMNRLGFFPDAAAISDIIKISEMENIEIEGLYSHFAESDSPDKTFTDYQAGVFSEFARKLAGDGVRVPLMHMANSGAVLTAPRHQYGMVRAGILIYGLSPSNALDISGMGFIPAMTVKSEVSFVKTVPAGAGVSYGRTFTTSRESRIATIPVGYADGYPRALSNKGSVIIRGKSAPVVGAVCMDQMMADVTEIGGVAPGDEVVLIGGGLGAGAVAERAGALCYEIVCALGNGKRNERIYKNLCLKTI